jgi:enterochelin esterase-like enzyme
MLASFAAFFFVMTGVSHAQDDAAKSLLQTFWEFPDRPELLSAIQQTFKPEDLKKGTAVAGHGENFLFAIDTPSSEPKLVIDGGRPTSMRRQRETNIWAAPARLKTGANHTFHFLIDGKPFGGSTDLAAYGPDSYQQPGVPQGKLHGKFVHTSKLNEGMNSDYWVYVPAQYDAATPAALMVWHDGEGHVNRNSRMRLQIVVDNLIHKKLMPVSIHVFVSPGKVGEKAMRSVLYDTVSDKYARLLGEELLPEVYAKWNIRKDAYSRGVGGGSSGGISAFNIAWHQPSQFARVHSHRGSFTALAWKHGQIESGETYPFKVRKEPKRNIRVWLQDGANDLENDNGSWPLQNIQLANSLKMREYDFRFSWHEGTHDNAHGNAEMPESLAWLWRGYDPAKTSEQFTMDPSEKGKDYYRVRIANRDFFRDPKHPSSPAPRFSLDAMKPEDIRKGTAVLAERDHFMLAVESPTKPQLIIDEAPGPEMKQASGNIWTVQGKWMSGRTHNFHYLVDGKKFGGKMSVIAYGPDSYEKPGVPKGTVSEKIVHTSKLYDGMTSDYWLYVPAQYNASKPAALMIWHDGEFYWDRNGESRAPIVIDNLTADGRMPVAIHVMLAPGKQGNRRMRSVLYDTVSDKYARMILEEVLPEVKAKYKIRDDAYSRAVLGESSGGVSAFNIAWQRPDAFSRVVCRIGTFESIQWKFNEQPGGHTLPFRVRRDPKKNLRVWLQDGSMDLENEHGSWPLMNIQMANSLKKKEYDFFFNYTNGHHTRALGHAELAEELAWIWRGYDPSKTSETYTMDPAEKDKPLYRVALLER